ncbi:MAG TPA: proton-conducting transporter membrane subunit [Coriobacteriia bacterium]
MSAEMLVFASLGPALAAGVAALILDAFSTRRAALWVAGAGLAASGAVCAWATATQPVSSAWSAVRTGGPFAAVAAVTFITAALAVLGGGSDLSRREGGGTLAALIAIGAVASAVMASAQDITLLLISLETAAACGYGLVSGARTARSDESAMKYFIQGAISTGFFVLGMAVMVTVFAPHGDLNSIQNMFEKPELFSVAVVGMVTLVAVLAFKAGVAPFHSWAPDAYETSTPEVAAFLSAGPKLAAITALVVLISLAASRPGADPAGKATQALAVIVSLLAVTSIAVGSLVALRQRSYTRMLAYAGIAQVGYALVGATVVMSPATAVFFASTYALASTGTFLAASAFRRARPGWDGSIAGLAGMGRTAPVLSASVGVLLISLAGIPPFLGFWAKLAAFGAAVLQSTAAFSDGLTTLGWASAVAAAAGIVGSVISLGYYGAVLRALYRLPEPQQVAETSADPAEAPTAAAGGNTAGIVVVFVALLVIALGLLPLVRGVGALVWPFTVR